MMDLHPSLGLMNKPVEWNAFMDDYTKCKWFDPPEGRVVEYGFGGTYDWSWECGPECWYPHPHSFNISLCREDGNKSTRYITKLGPFNATGGADWHAIILDDAVRLPPAAREKLFLDKLFLNQLVSFPVDASGQPVSFPPVHNHHSSMLESTSKYPHFTLLNHQDNTCDDEVGGMRCLMVSLPEGTAMVADPVINYDGLMQDVRPAGSKKMFFSIVVGVRAMKELPHRSVKLWRVDPYPGVTNGAKRTPFGTFPIPPDTPSVTWFSTVVPFSGKVLARWHHSHTTHGHVETWYTDAVPAVIGLDDNGRRVRTTASAMHIAEELHTDWIIGGTGFVAPLHWPSAGRDDEQLKIAIANAPWTKKKSSTIWVDLDAVKADLAKRIQERGYSVRCKATYPADISLKTGDRQMYFFCNDAADTVVEGQVITVFAFWDGYAVTDFWYWQHHHYQAIIEIEGVHDYDVHSTAVYETVRNDSLLVGDEFIAEYSNQESDGPGNASILWLSKPVLLLVAAVSIIAAIGRHPGPGVLCV